MYGGGVHMVKTSSQRKLTCANSQSTAQVKPNWFEFTCQSARNAQMAPVTQSDPQKVYARDIALR